MFVLYFAIIVCSIYWIYTKLFKKPIFADIPGPKGHAIVGNILQLDKQKPHLQLAKWARDFGGIYKVNLGGNIVAVVNDCNLIYEALVTKGNDFAARPKSFITDMFFSNCSTLVFANRTPKMVHTKKLLMSQMKMSSKAIEELFVHETQQMIEQIKSHDGQPTDAMSIVENMVTATISCLTLSRPPSAEEVDTIHFVLSAFVKVSAIGGGGELLNRFPWIRHLWNPTWKLLKSLMEIQKRKYKIWKQEVGETDSGGSSYMAELLNIMKGPNPLGYTEENIMAEVWAMFVAGIGTTSSTFTSLINILAHKQDIQDKLWTEVNTALQGRLPDLNDRSSMPYHMAVIYEANRYLSVVPLTLPRMTTCDTELAGHQIPAGATVWINLWSLHHDDAVFEQPFDFRPERYINDAGQLVAADHPARKNNFAFGAGPRVCPGEVFAMSRMFLMLAYLVQSFEIQPAAAKEQQASMDCRDMILGTMLMPPPVNVRFIKRQEN